MKKLRRIALALTVLVGALTIAQASAFATTGADRVGWIDQAGNLYVQEGALAAGGILQESGVASFQLEVDRVMALTTTGELLVKEGDLGPGWHTVDTGVTQAELDGDRIGYQKADGVYVATDLYDTPVKVWDGAVPRWQIEGDRVAVLVSNKLWVKDDSTAWTSIAPTVVTTNFQLHGDRIAHAYAGHHETLVKVRAGAITAPDVLQANGVSKFQLSLDRIAMDGWRGLEVREGAPDAERHLIHEPGTDRAPFYLDSDRIGFVKDGDLWVVEGAIDAEPVLAVPDVGAFQLDGDRIAESDAYGFRVKEGAPDAGFVTISETPVKAFQIGADMHPPVKSVYWT